MINADPMRERKPMLPNDEQLMAFVDGVLPPDAARSVADAQARDPALALCAEQLARTRALAREALNAPDLLTVPPALRAKVEAMVAAKKAAASAAQAEANLQHSQHSPGLQAQATPRSHGYPAAAGRAPTRTGWWQRFLDGWSSMAMPVTVAASVLFGVVGFQLGRGPAGEGAGPGIGTDLALVMGSDMALPVGAAAPTALAAVLDRLPSGEQQEAGGTPIVVAATYRDATGQLCRDFALGAAEGQRTEAVACRQGPGEWVLRYAAAVPDAGSGYAPASATSALENYLSSIGAVRPLDPVAEEGALARR